MCAFKCSKCENLNYNPCNYLFLNLLHITIKHGLLCNMGIETVNVKIRGKRLVVMLMLKSKPKDRVANP